MQSLKVFAINGQEITHSEEIQLAICTGGLIVPMGKMTVEKKSLKSVLVKSCSVDHYWSVETCVGNEVVLYLAGSAINSFGEFL